MSDNKYAIVPVSQRGVVVSVTRQITITEKLLKRIQSVQKSTEWHNQAYEFYLKENWPGLLKHALRWTQALPENESAWHYLGFAYNNSNQEAKAIEAYRQAIRINPEDAFAWYDLGNNYLIAFLISNYPADWGDGSCHDPGIDDALAKAIDSYQQAIRIDPDYAFAWHNLGNAYYRSNQRSKAIEAYHQAIRIIPKNAFAWFNLGCTYYHDSKQVSKMFEAYQQAIRINPEYADAWNNISVAYSRENQYDKEDEACQQVIRIDPKYMEHHDFRGPSLAAYYSCLPDKAIESYQQAIRINPEDAIAWCNLGIAYNYSNQPAKAIVSCQQAIRINPEDAIVWYNLGIAYKKSNHPNQSIEVYKRLKTLEPALAAEFFNKFFSP